MEEKQADICLYCKAQVRDLEAAVECDGCYLWCHVKCKTGMTIINFSNWFATDSDNNTLILCV